LRAQQPPCPWDSGACAEAAGGVVARPAAAVPLGLWGVR